MKTWFMIGLLTVASATRAGPPDADGLPDDWETQYYGGPTNAQPAARAANGVNSVRECYVAGLDPHNPTNVLQWFSITPLPDSNGWRRLRWSAVTGRVYSVLGAELPATPGWNLLGQTTDDTFLDTNSTPAALYRLGVEIAP